MNRSETLTDAARGDKQVTLKGGGIFQSSRAVQKLVGELANNIVRSESDSRSLQYRYLYCLSWHKTARGRPDKTFARSLSSRAEVCVIEKGKLFRWVPCRGGMADVVGTRQVRHCSTVTIVSHMFKKPCPINRNGLPLTCSSAIEKVQRLAFVAQA